MMRWFMLLVLLCCFGCGTKDTEADIEVGSVDTRIDTLNDTVAVDTIDTFTDLPTGFTGKKDARE